MNAPTAPELAKLVESLSSTDACRWFRAQVRLLLEDAAELTEFASAFADAGRRIPALPLDDVDDALRGWSLDDAARAALLLMFIDGQPLEERERILLRVLSAADARARHAVTLAAPLLRSASLESRAMTPRPDSASAAEEPCAGRWQAPVSSGASEALQSMARMAAPY